MRFFRGMIAFSLISLVGQELVLSAPPESSQSSSEDPMQAEVTALISQLGDAQFARREGATENLIRLGLPAMVAVEVQATENASREIRYRCKVILKTLRKIDFQRRLTAFAANRDSGEDYDLPGWKRYQDLVGKNAQARGLFVEMLKTEADTLQQIEASPQGINEVFAGRTQELQFAISQLRQQPKLGSIVTMLFLAGDANVTIDQQRHNMVYNLCNQTTFRTAITSGPNKELIEKLLGAWIRRGEGWAAYQVMMMAMQYNLKDGLVPAEKALKNGVPQPHVRQYALLTIAKFGDRSHFPLLESSLQDETTCSNIRIDKKNIPIQVRDIALAMLVHMSKQDLKKYGFNRAQANDQMVFSPTTLVLETPEIREKALKTWKQFRAEEKKKAG